MLLKIKSNQTQIYIVPYIASESEALGLGLDPIGYAKQFSLYVTLKTHNAGVMSQIVLEQLNRRWLSTTCN